MHFFINILKLIVLSTRHGWCNLIETSIFWKSWMNQKSLERQLFGMSVQNLYTHSYKQQNIKTWFYCLHFFCFDVKPFCTDWYRRPGDLIDLCSQFNVPNDYNIKKTWISCFNRETALLWICCRYFIHGFTMDVMTLNCLNSSLEKKIFLIIVPFCDSFQYFLFWIGCVYRSCYM